jgi:hypothetical protein
MRSDWSDEEVLLIVEDYFAMLDKELRGEAYNKTAHRTRIMPQLRNRSPGSVERKHQNISAILLEAGFPFIEGYKPLRNYQRALASVVLDRVGRHGQLLATVENLVDEVPSNNRRTIAKAESVFAPAPDPIVREHGVRGVPAHGAVGTYDFPERDARNRELGRRGEEFVLDLERAKLAESGRRDLAKNVEWIAETRGPAAGYDIRSFSDAGRELFIEVKTTNFGPRFPFVISRNELVFSGNNDYGYRLYRLYRFSRDPRCYVRPGAVSRWFVLEPRSFYARV